MRQGFAATDDGGQVFYRAVGAGSPALVCSNGIGVSTFFWEYLTQRFSSETTVVLWDYQGHGRSALPGTDKRLTISQCARDLGTVVSTLGLERPVLLGHSMGAQVALERYRQSPESVGGIVTVLGAPGHPLDTFNDLAISRKLFDLLIQLHRSFPTAMDWLGKSIVSVPGAYDLAKALRLVDGDRLSRHDLRQYLRHLCDVGFPFFFQLAQEMGEHTTADYLDKIQAPVLIVAGENDAFTPAHLSQSMDERLPRSRLVWLEGASHAGIVEQPEAINAAVARFLDDLRAEAI